MMGLTSYQYIVQNHNVLGTYPHLRHPVPQPSHINLEPFFGGE